MAITISFPAANITTDLTAKTVTFVDGTTYTSPLRTAQGVFVKIYKVDYSGNRIAVTTTANNIDPASAATNTWVATYNADGWYQLFYLAAPTYAGGTTYAQYDAVYDTTSKSIYRSKSNGNIGNAINNTIFWEAISDPTSLALNVGTATQSVNLNTNTSVSILNLGVYPATKAAFGNATGDAFLEATSTYKRSENVRTYELLGLAVDSMKVAESRQNYSALEMFARRASSIIATL